MNDFTATNNVTVSHLTHADVWTVDPAALKGPFSRMNANQMQALREFFQAEADERLGRWRWPENPEFVVYPPRPGFTSPDGCDLFVVNELWGSALAYLDSEFASYDEEDGAFAAAGRAYFNAHPEPKPWQDAQPGELWVIRLAGQEEVGVSVETFEPGADVFQVPDGESISINRPSIIAGRRIWPEVSA